MLNTTDPLAEKTALLWHGHFATSSDKVKDSISNNDIIDTFRKHGLGDFKTLVTKVSQTPAMLRYLDNNRNRKGKPNENFAREIMELFTLGIGNYTENDIKEAARSFTGWTYYNSKRQFVDNKRNHDPGTKTFLGKTGKFTGNDIIRIICEQEQMPRYIGSVIWEYYCYQAPGEKLVDELAAEFKKANGNIGKFLTTIFMSKEFYSKRTIGTQIKSPTQLVVNLVDSLQLDQKKMRPELINLAMRGMGQQLLAPPNVKGWDGNRAWINTNTLLVRYNIPSYLLSGNMPNQRKKPSLDEADDGSLKSKKAQWQNQWVVKQRNRFFNPGEFFKNYKEAPAGKMVDAMTEYFLGKNVDREQRQILIQTLSSNQGEKATIANNQKDNERKRATLHLILSMAEYQLC